MFDYGSMPVATAVPREVVLARLQAQVNTLERRGHAPAYAVTPGLAPVLDGGLKPGAAYALEQSAAGALLLALLAAPSQDGLWCGLVGLPDVGIEAAKLAGVSLDRLALVPDPGVRWLSVVATLSLVLPVLAVRPPGPVRPADAAKLAARLRDHETVLLVVGSWPGAEAVIGVDEPQWQGIGEGYGYLARREVAIHVTSKRSPRPRRVRVMLPSADGTVVPVSPDQWHSTAGSERLRIAA